MVDGTNIEQEDPETQIPEKLDTVTPKLNHTVVLEIDKGQPTPTCLHHDGPNSGFRQRDQATSQLEYNCVLTTDTMLQGMETKNNFDPENGPSQIHSVVSYQNGLQNTLLLTQLFLKR